MGSIVHFCTQFVAPSPKQRAIRVFINTGTPPNNGRVFLFVPPLKKRGPPVSRLVLLARSAPFRGSCPSPAQTFGMEGQACAKIRSSSCTCSEKLSQSVEGFLGLGSSGWLKGTSKGKPALWGANYPILITYPNLSSVLPQLIWVHGTLLDPLVDMAVRSPCPLEKGPSKEASPKHMGVRF